MSLLQHTTLLLFLFLLTTVNATAAVPETCSANPIEEIPDSCASNLTPERRETYDNGRIIDISHRITPNMPAFRFDISHRITPNMPAFRFDAGLGQFVWLVASRRNGSLSNNSEFKLSIHTGTHVDSPAHFYTEYLDAGFDVDTLDLAVLNGPALLVDVPRDSNITEVVMKSLHIPKGVRRVLFRTLNTDKGLMFQKEFDSSYTGFMKDGAQWLIDNTDIKLVGIDYLSAAAFDHLEAAHLVFLKSREIILVEGLKLDDIPAGLYNVHCLPLRLLGAEGSPTRCILIK